MLIFLSCFILMCLSEKIYGGWQLMYFDGKGECDGKIIADKYTDECINLQKNTSMKFYCSDSVPRNFSQEIYISSNCSGKSAASSSLGEVGICLKSGNKGREYRCKDQYEVKFPHQVWAIPLNFSSKQIGTYTNPVMTEKYIPLAKCFSMPGHDYHFTTTCDPKKQIGVFKVFKKSLCWIPIESYQLKINQVVDMKKYYGKDLSVVMYWKFLGCK